MELQRPFDASWGMPRKDRSPLLGRTLYPVRPRPSPGIVVTLDALEALASTDRPRSLTELVSMTGASRATLLRVLGMLVDRGYAGRDPRSGRFALSLRLLQLAHRHDPVSRITEAFGEPMEDLVAETGCATYVALLERDRVVVVAARQPEVPATEPSEVGFRAFALHSETGWLLLAHGNPNALRRTVWRSDAYRSLRGRERGAFWDAIPMLRHCRSVTEGRGLARGSRDTAVAIGSSRETFAVAWAVAMPELRGARAKHESVLTRLREEGGRIAEKLGLSAPSRDRPRDR